MASDRQKFQKKKDRERAVRKKVLHRRSAVREEKASEQAREDNYEAEYAGPQRQMPVVNDPEKRDEMIKARLRENMKVLKALEDEHLAEERVRKDANEKLESEGAGTITEKLSALGLGSRENISDPKN